MKDKTFVALTGIFFLVFLIAVVSLTFNTQLSSILSAKNVSPSSLKSFGVVFPQVGVVQSRDGTKPGTKIKVSIYIRDNSGDLLAKRSVKLTSDLQSVTIIPNVDETNDIGQAEFQIISTSVGKARLVATDVASNTEIINIPTVEFTQ